MTDTHALVLSHGDDDVTAAVVDALKRDDWTVDVRRGSATAMTTDEHVHGVVYLPGLLEARAIDNADPATELLNLVEALQPNLRASGGARVVAVGSRDWLGWPTRPRLAAQSAGLIATVRSLALGYGRSGVAVNAVIGLPTDDDGPKPLTPAPVSADDIAHTVAFLLDERSAYITGQTLHCCGGASLLSSMSV